MRFWHMVPLVVSLTGCSSDTQWTSMPNIDHDGDIWVTRLGLSGSTLSEFRLSSGNNFELLSSTTPGTYDRCVVASPVEGEHWSYTLQVDSPKTDSILRYQLNDGVYLEQGLHALDSRVAIFPDKKCAVVVRPRPHGFVGYEKLLRVSLEDNGEGKRLVTQTVEPDHSIGAWHMVANVTPNVANGWIAMTTQDGRPTVWSVETDGLKSLSSTQLELPMNEETGSVWADLSEDLSKVVVCKSLKQDYASYQFEISVWELESGRRIFRREPEASDCPVAVAFAGNSEIVICDSDFLTMIDLQTDIESKIKRTRTGFVPTRILPLKANRVGLVESVDRRYRFFIQELAKR